MMSWVKATFYRVVRTGAQAAIGAIGAAAVFSQIRWDEVAGVVGIAMLLAFLMALACLPETPQDGPLENLGERGQSILVVAAIAAVVCFLLLLALDLSQLN